MASYFGYPHGGVYNNASIDFGRIPTAVLKSLMVEETRTPLQELTERVWAEVDETDALLAEAVDHHEAA